MELTRKQEEGLKIAVERYNQNMPWTCIAGYAGTGKSTLVKFIVSALNVDAEDVCYIAYTGKAAKVLQEKGCPNAMTAHRLLYKSFPRMDGTYAHMPKRPLEHDYKLIVVDEVSMLPKKMWELLLSHGIYVLALGDPGQLPPIGDDNEVLKHPHVFLDEIMRQAQESEIIRLTMDIREGKPLNLYSGQEVRILNSRDLTPGMLLWANQVLVGKNKTRRCINSIMRRYIYDQDIGEAPVEGDKIICLKNNWDHLNGMGDVMVNGSIGTIHDIRTASGIFYPTVMRANFISDEYNEEEVERCATSIPFKDVLMDYQLFTTGAPTVNARTFRKIPPKMQPKEFDYGYCITTHKAQGSEYDKVLVLEEFLKDDKTHKEWLYTAATRAKEKLVILKDFR